MIDQTATELMPLVDTKGACQAVGRARATVLPAPPAVISAHAPQGATLLPQGAGGT